MSLNTALNKDLNDILRNEIRCAIRERSLSSDVLTNAFYITFLSMLNACDESTETHYGIMIKPILLGTF